MNNTRREFLATAGMAAGAGLLSEDARAQETQNWPGFIDTNEMHTVNFMDQYYNGLTAIARGILDTQVDNIAAAMEKAYECRRNGGTVCADFVFTHAPEFEMSPERPGQPWILPLLDDAYSMNKNSYSRLKKGDFVLACRNTLDKSEIEARKRGVFIAGVTNPFFKFAETPEGVLFQDQSAVEDFANIKIDSQTTWEVGLVKSPKLHFSFCPVGPTAIYLVYWAATASLANLISTKGRGSAAEPARRYLEMAVERMEWIGTSRPKITAVTEEWADRMIDRKARIMMYGRPMPSAAKKTTRLSNVFTDEATGAGSCQMVMPLGKVIDINIPSSIDGTRPGNIPKPGDIVIIGGITSDNEDEINVAREVRKIGAQTVAFCPFKTEGDSSDYRLFREVDHAFDTYSYERAGVFESAGFKEKVSPLSTVTANLVHWMLTASWADHMARRGEHPYFRQPYCYVGAGEYNRNVVVPNAPKRGY
jgi:hypothetical protein